MVIYRCKKKEENNMKKANTIITIYHTLTQRYHFIVVHDRERAYNKMNELMKSYTDQGIDFFRIGSLTLYVD